MIKLRKEQRPGSTAIMWHVEHHTPQAGWSDFWSYNFADAIHVAGKWSDRLLKEKKERHESWLFRR